MTSSALLVLRLIICWPVKKCEDDVSQKLVTRNNKALKNYKFKRENEIPYHHHHWNSFFSSLKVEVKVENFCSLAAGYPAAFLHIIMGGFHLHLLIFLSYSSPSPNVSTTPLRKWGFWQCLPFSLTTLRGKHCRNPIAVMGVAVCLVLVYRMTLVESIFWNPAEVIISPKFQNCLIRGVN